MTRELQPSRRTVLGGLAATGFLATTGIARADATGRIQDIVNRPQFRGARWGMTFHALDSGETWHVMNPAELFTASSSFKIFLGGTAFEALGPDHRFRTRVYRTGPVTGGVLHGDLVLVASGDMLLSGRVRPDGSLNLPDPDHTYPIGRPLPGDRLAEIRDLAAQIKAAGVRRVTGKVSVDVSLFREGQESIAINNQLITVSPMMVNDHMIHAAVTPGAAVGDPAVVQAIPQTGYVRFVNKVTTVSGTPKPLVFVGDRLTGEIQLGSAPRYVAHYVREPSRFAAVALTEALRDRGVQVRGEACRAARRIRIAEHVSLPFAEQSKVMLKVSSNIHTATIPYLVGGIAGRAPGNPKASYEDFRRALFRKAGLDPDPAGSAEGRYTVETFIKFLAYVAKRPYIDRFRSALPIMGRDGTLAGNQPDSPAAGHVYAKTGTGLMGPTLNKALAGYIELPGGRWLAFAQFMRLELASAADGRALDGQAQEAMAEICTAVYEEHAR
ncbi:D-alanyl-D-alanine carboxypeptidase/D-alanyl-D-alanine-endopeptidase [Kibdelosporangium persicum]|uniref:D-alanyl-D-alanine carboxypeptidase/D-alanyl-D-alanine-endopeptidase n=1 Tax=Kibdelosporangium persicum TaxID=2698649 RepID=A0ABX2EVT0_9PSEU|nr:D-alanyl-D-alanine carboxypeptidase/D-alanyl-D-alanine-endopeptidase [Kibdelosporangium persicum]NRN62999.1 D-alanyl-D-alanine carboxypeptidase/D-alanyl-D-alanine-endopeptidase [Kibdelosporangium persicum]